MMVKKHFLVVDNQSLLRYGMKRALSQDLIEVDTAATASEALQAFRSRSYDLCFLDPHLSDANGFTMMDTIRDFCPGIKFILMTSDYVALNDELRQNIAKAEATGEFHLLPKPFGLTQLNEAVLRALKNKDGVGKCDKITETFSGISRRQLERTQWHESIHFSMSTISDGQVKRMTYAAEIVDITDNGIGLTTSCPLKPNQVISFDEGLERKTGVVLWSCLLDDLRCRAGIRIA